MSSELYEIRSRPLREDAELMDYIRNYLETFSEQSNHYDLTNLPYDEVINLMSGLTAGADIVLHGSDSETPHAELDPTFSRQLTKVPSIFGSTDARVALMNAVFRAKGEPAKKIRSEVDEKNAFAASMYVHGQTKIFEAPPGIAAALREALTTPDTSEEFNAFFTDGLVYVTAGRLFMRDDPRLGEDGQRVGGVGYTDHELNCPDVTTPLATLRVSKRLARDLFRLGGGEDDTVHIYSEEEMELRRRWRRKILPAMGQAAVGLQNNSPRL